MLSILAFTCIHFAVFPCVSEKTYVVNIGIYLHTFCCVSLCVRKDLCCQYWHLLAYILLCFPGCPKRLMLSILAFTCIHFAVFPCVSEKTYVVNIGIYLHTFCCVSLCVRKDCFPVCPIYLHTFCCVSLCVRKDLCCQYWHLLAYILLCFPGCRKDLCCQYWHLLAYILLCFPVCPKRLMLSILAFTCIHFAVFPWVSEKTYVVNIGIYLHTFCCVSLCVRKDLCCQYWHLLAYILLCFPVCPKRLMLSILAFTCIHFAVFPCVSEKTYVVNIGIYLHNFAVFPCVSENILLCFPVCPKRLMLSILAFTCIHFAVFPCVSEKTYVVNIGIYLHTFCCVSLCVRKDLCCQYWHLLAYILLCFPVCPKRLMLSILAFTCIHFAVFPCVSEKTYVVNIGIYLHTFCCVPCVSEKTYVVILAFTCIHFAVFPCVSEKDLCCQYWHLLAYILLCFPGCPKRLMLSILAFTYILLCFPVCPKRLMLSILAFTCIHFAVFPCLSEKTYVVNIGIYLHTFCCVSLCVRKDLCCQYWHLLAYILLCFPVCPKRLMLSILAFTCIHFAVFPCVSEKTYVVNIGIYLHTFCCVSLCVRKDLCC